MREVSEIKIPWVFPVDMKSCPGVPVGEHLGAFGAFRGHDKRHCGVDLYVPSNTVNYVGAVEAGVVVSIDWFTGDYAGSPWWNNTMAVRVLGESGIVCYGEIFPYGLKVGDKVGRGSCVGLVKQVLKDDKLRSDIKGHSLAMLHLQLYTHDMIHKEESWMHENKEPPVGVLDPTQFLLDSQDLNGLSPKKLEK